MWIQQYKDLKKFINASPSISITENTVSIPGDVRAEFYSHFDALRAGFIRDRFVIDLDRADALKEAYGAASDAVRGQMHLDGIETSNNLKWFLLDPLNGLMRTLFDPVFDLLKGKLDVNSFGTAAESVVKTMYQPLFAEGYQRWATLALMQQMAAERLWSGKTAATSDDMLTKRDIFSAIKDASPPSFSESGKLDFANVAGISFLMPEAIVYAAKLPGYAAFVRPSNISYLKSSFLNKKLDWRSQKQIKQDFGAGDLWPDMMLYVSDESVDELKIVADSDLLARPSLVIEVMEEESWCYEKNTVSLARHCRALAPSEGSYVISRVETDAEKFRQLCPDENIHLVNTGYDASRLSPVTDALCRVIAARKEARKAEQDAKEKPAA